MTVVNKKPTADRKKQINFQILQSTGGNSTVSKKQSDAMHSAFLQSGFYFENLEDPFIEEHIANIKKDPKKVTKFKEMVDFYIQNK